MEPHGSLRLLLVLLCLAISIVGVRSRILLDGFPTPEPAAARLVPDVSPTAAEPAAAGFAPDASPTPEPVADELAPEISPTPGEPVASPAPSPLRSKGFSLEGIGAVLANSPDKSAAAAEAAVLVEEIDMPSAKEMVNGIDVPAALNSVDENTLKTLQSFM